MRNVNRYNIIALILGVFCGVVAFSSFPNVSHNLLGGGPGTINQLDQWRATTTPYDAITTNQNNKNIYIPNSIATTSRLYSDTFCINNTTPDCITSWPAGGGGGGGATTTINGVDGPDFTFATGTATGIGLTIATSSGTLTFTPTVSSGYVIPLTASTTEWATAFGWGDHAGAGYLTAVNWGDIGGTLSNQTDLQSALDAKEDSLTTGNLTEAVTGLEFNNTRQVIGGAAELALSTGFTIPLTASTTEWATAYGWGDHSLESYLTTVAPTDLNSADFGDFTCNGTSCALDNDVVTPNDVLSTGQTDEYCLTYEATGTTWEWYDCTGGSSEWTDGGAFLYTTEATDRVLVGTSTDDNRGQLVIATTTNHILLAGIGTTRDFSIYNGGNSGLIFEEVNNGLTFAQYGCDDCATDDVWISYVTGADNVDIQAVTSATNAGLSMTASGNGDFIFNTDTNSFVGIGDSTPTQLLDLAASGSLGFAGTPILSDSAGTLTLQNVDAIDATTETTLEAAIDALSNLTTVGTLSSGTLALDSLSYTGTIGTSEIDDAYLLNNGDTASGDYNFSSGTLFIDDSEGRVGIGNATPGALLDLSGGTGLNLGVSQIAHDDFTNEGIGLTFSRTTDTADLMAIGVVDSTSLGIFSRGGLIFGTGGASLYSATEEAMRLTATGNMGIGTTTPGAKITAQGASSGTIIQLVSNTGTKFMEMLNTGATTLRGPWNFGGATVTGIPVDRSWSIASTSPDYLGNTLSTATTTWEVAHFAAETTVNSIRCETDTGTALVRVGDGSNWTEDVSCSATPTRNSALSNNTFSAEEDFVIEIGTSGSNPNWVTVDIETER